MKLSPSHITRLTAGLTVLIAAAGFVLSFTALRDLAAHNGISDNLAFLFPLLADLVVVAASLSVIGQHLEGQSAKYQWTLVGLFTGLSVILNGMHAYTNSGMAWLPIALSIVPPIALFLTFELLAVQIQRAVKRSGAQDTLQQLSENIKQAQRELSDTLRTGEQQKQALSDQIAALSSKRDALTADIEQLKHDKRAVKRERPAPDVQPGAETPPDMSADAADKTLWGLPASVRRDMLARDIRTANGHGAPSAADIAAKYGISERQARRDLAELQTSINTSEN